MDDDAVISTCFAIEKLCTLATDMVATNAPTQEAANLIVLKYDPRLLVTPLTSRTNGFAAATSYRIQSTLLARFRSSTF